ncbi:methylenetetrahydrofolate reductase [Paenibacillus sp. HJGM_3]|uniref:methylenetetrahydrofolate reductase n=1 Tax=Paenibacillus sp. HJGM_3 TaxID=3379816 RepID=UPI00385DFFD5
MNLKEKIIGKQAGILSYGMTPPKANTPPEQLAEIARKQCERLRDVNMDALILYDVQEESDRVDQERPFPYTTFVDPTEYSEHYMAALDLPKIIYRCVGKYTKAEQAEWIASDADRDRFAVFVGAASRTQPVKSTLADSYALSGELNGRLLFGGVVIPERHLKYGDEHLRMVNKIRQGCRFFVSQATYNIEASKDLLSDYYYYRREHGLEMVPILFNLAPCGSPKTLAFMKWLGISMPRWLENDLVHSADILEKSLHQSRTIFEELFEFGLEKGIPVGCSVESVSTRKVEIEASIQLVKDIKGYIDRKLGS